jgi:ribosomal protein S18 acetylase RimI-like enzyme
LVLIRRSQPAERHSIRALVESVLNEVYGGVWTQSPLSADEEEWALAWVAVSGTTIIGMVLTHEEWISDLWVLREHRGCGVGRLLLLQGEAEIAGRGYQTFRLRVVKTNVSAVSFYHRRGWRLEREFRHETLPITMLEMTKGLDQEHA